MARAETEREHWQWVDEMRMRGLPYAECEAERLRLIAMGVSAPLARLLADEMVARRVYE